ncbi:ATP-binding protein [Natrinema sp. DC36]|uniref:sensor histidine kinase n=1 Tax=Natrinema sp. DC36 TaxID=2878680 RepID=UPI001CF06CB5|nr:ATP-binding protein [Natrinema sp. DC36]
MPPWSRSISTVGGPRFISALGGLFVVLGAVQIHRNLVTDGPTGEISVDFLLFAWPAVTLLYGGYWLGKSDLPAARAPRVAGWCLGGLAVMLGVTTLLVLNPDVILRNPVREIGILTAVGTIGGLGVGVMEARALTRAAEAERSERALRKERNFVEQLVRTAPIGIATLDHDGTFDYHNEQVEEIFGDAPEAVGDYENRIDEFDLIRLDGTPLAPEETPAYRIMEREETVHDGPIGLKNADGQRVWLLISGNPLRGDERRNAVLTYTDITEQIESERDLRRSNDRLEQFAYAASHDLQEPLRMISSYLQLLESRYADDLDAEGREFVEFAVDGADRMRQMIQALLEYSRVDKDEGSFEPVDLDSVLADVRADLAFRIEESGAEITADSLPRVIGDEEQLRHVFQNLLDNAIEYSGEGAPRVDVSAERDGDEWRIAVRDDGIGIDADELDRIFEVFERLHPPDEHEGTGIGLALCERIVERHCGEIWVESVPGDGATFYFTIPTEAQSEPSSVNHPSNRDRNHGAAE